MDSWIYEISLLVLKKYFTRSLRSLVNKKLMIFWNTVFYHPAKFELIRIKNAKVVPSLQLFACVLAQRGNIFEHSKR